MCIIDVAYQTDMFGIYCHFSYAGTWELVNLFVRKKSLATIFVNIGIGQKHNKILCSQETDRPWADRTEEYASKEKCIK